MFKNPLNTDQDIDDLVAELKKEGSDAKTVAKLYGKLLAKGVATGALYAAGLVAASAVVFVAAAKIYGTDMEDDTLNETEED